MAWLNRVSLGNFTDLAGAFSEQVKNLEKNLGLENLNPDAQGGLWQPDGLGVFDAGQTVANQNDDEDASNKSSLQEDSVPSQSARAESSKKAEMLSDSNQEKEQEDSSLQKDESVSPMHRDESDSRNYAQQGGVSEDQNRYLVDDGQSNSESPMHLASSIVEEKHDEPKHAQIDSVQVIKEAGEFSKKKPESENIPSSESPTLLGETQDGIPEQNNVHQDSEDIAMAKQVDTSTANDEYQLQVNISQVGDRAVVSMNVISDGNSAIVEHNKDLQNDSIKESLTSCALIDQTVNEDLSEVDKLKLEVEKLRKERELTEAALQGAARQSQAKADEISRLLIENDHLKNTVDDMKRKSVDSDTDALKDEYQQRLGALERKVYSLTKERDTLRRENNRRTDTAALLKEKDDIITQVMAEGEELSKKQAAQEAQMRKLRAQIRSLEEEKQKLISKLQVEEAKVESIRKDKAATEKALQEAVENSQAGLAAQKEFYTNALNEAKEAQALAEARANSEAKIELENRLREAGERESALVNALEKLRETLSNTERQAAAREDALQNEIDHLQKRCQASEMRYEELVMRVPESTRPLLRQIEAMQESAAMRAEAWSGVERSLNARLQEAETKAAAAEERERSMNDRLSQTLSRMAVLEAQLSCLKTEQAQLSRTLEKERHRASENRQEYLTAIEKAASQEGQAKQLEMEISELRKQHKREMVEEMTRRELLEQELEREKTTRLELEKKVNNETWGGSDRNSSFRNAGTLIEQGPNHHLRRYSSATSMGSMEESLYLQATLESSSEQAIQDRKSPSEVTGSGYFGRTIMPVTIEHLESALRQKEGELSSYLAQLASLESIRDSLAEELVKMTNECEKLRIEVAALPGIKAELEALRQRHASALELMGERDEELEELRADLADVKEMYREQVDLLVNQIEKLSSALSSR